MAGKRDIESRCVHVAPLSSSTIAVVLNQQWMKCFLPKGHMGTFNITRGPYTIFNLQISLL